jgi:hypothetical protein
MRILAVVGMVWVAAAEVVVLESGEARLGIETEGGAIVDFQLKRKPLNPLTWEEASRAANRWRGHFVCFDRWGAPSEAERANGMPYHGEAAKATWQVTKKTATTVEMEARLPMVMMEMQRKVTLAGAVATVEETVRNAGLLSRPYNLVQHPTIAPPFLDEETVVDANARRGFSQASPMPNPEAPEFVWPAAMDGARMVDIRRLRDDAAPNVASYVVDEEWGWTTALSPTKGLLIGYRWKTAEYAWFNVWRDVRNGKPAARGLEFGTTGLHQPFPVLARKGTIFGRALFVFADAGEAHTRTYEMFLAEAPAGMKAVATVERRGGALVVKGDREGVEIVIKQ